MNTRSCIICISICRQRILPSVQCICCVPRKTSSRTLPTGVRSGESNKRSIRKQERSKNKAELGRAHSLTEFIVAVLPFYESISSAAEICGSKIFEQWFFCIFSRYYPSRHDEKYVTRTMKKRTQTLDKMTFNNIFRISAPARSEFCFILNKTSIRTCDPTPQTPRHVITFCLQ